MALQIFTDGSSDPVSKIGYGAMLAVDESDLRSLDELRDKVETIRFELCSSSDLEIQVANWAICSLSGTVGEVRLYTDSQTLLRLPERREGLVVSGFRSASGEILRNAELYREFYDEIDRLDIELFKVKGHQPGRDKTRLDRLFSFVDKAARRALRSELKARR